MSRVGKKPIAIPEGVTVTMNHFLITAKGPKGELSLTTHRDVTAEVQESKLVVGLRKGSVAKNALWGLMRSLINNMIVGVSKGFDKVLEFEGIGFRANVEGTTLVMQLGFSHPVRFESPKGITIAVQKNTISISGIDKALVGETAARIRHLKEPEPYKGKGIRYRGEIIRRKAGKKASTSA